MTVKKNPAKTPMATPSHGRGKLRRGGTNKGGTGRPPEALRIKSRAVFEKWLAWAAKRVADPETDDSLMLQIGNTAAKYGLGTTFTPTDTSGKTLTAGVLAVPMMPNAAQWGITALAQQSALVARPGLAEPQAQ